MCDIALASRIYLHREVFLFTGGLLIETVWRYGSHFCLLFLTAVVGFVSFPLPVCSCWLCCRSCQIRLTHVDARGRTALSHVRSSLLLAGSTAAAAAGVWQGAAGVPWLRPRPERLVAVRGLQHGPEGLPSALWNLEVRCLYTVSVYDKIVSKSPNSFAFLAFLNVFLRFFYELFCFLDQPCLFWEGDVLTWWNCVCLALLGFLIHILLNNKRMNAWTLCITVAHIVMQWAVWLFVDSSLVCWWWWPLSWGHSWRLNLWPHVVAVGQVSVTHAELSTALLLQINIMRLANVN